MNIVKQSLGSYSEGLGMSESYHLLVAAVLGLGGFSQFSIGHPGSSSESWQGQPEGMPWAGAQLSTRNPEK